MTFNILVEGFWDFCSQWILVYGDNTKLVTVIVSLYSLISGLTSL